MSAKLLCVKLLIFINFFIYDGLTVADVVAVSFITLHSQHFIEIYPFYIVIMSQFDEKYPSIIQHYQ